MTPAQFKETYPGSARLPVKLMYGCKVLAMHELIKEKPIMVPNADVVGPMTPIYRSRVNAAWDHIQRINPLHATRLQDWMSDGVGRKLISDYVVLFIQPPTSNYMTAHETRQLQHKQKLTLFGIKQFKPSRPTSQEARVFLNRLNNTDKYDPAFAMLADFFQ